MFKRGTLMVLKRFLMAALGAFGLGALATGPAFSQQIPAPDLYTDVTACTPGQSEGPTDVLKGRSGGALSIIDAALSQTDGTTGARTGIPTTAVTGLTAAQIAAITATYEGEACESSDAVKLGISAAKTVERQVALHGPITEGGAPINQELYDRYTGDRDLLKGDIYDAVIEQQKRVTQVSEATTAYNNYLTTVDGGSGTTLAAPGTVPYVTSWGNYRDIEVNSFDDPATADVNPYGSGMTVNGFRGFSVNGNTGLVDPAAASVAPISTIPAGATDYDLDQDSTTTTAYSVETFGGIETALADAEKGLKKLQADRDKATATAIPDLDRRIGIAQRVKDYISSEKTRLQTAALQAETASTGGSPLAGLTTVAEFRTELGKRIGDFTRANTHAASLAGGVKEAVTNLQTARNAVNAGLTKAGTYLDQLVALRKYQKAVAERGTNAVTKKDAQTNLTEAESLLSQHKQLAGVDGDTDNPATALLASLLKPEKKANGDPNPEDDDGKALLTAISTNYNKIKDVEKMIPDALEMDTSGIATNTNDIKTLDTTVTTLEGEVETNGMDLDDVWEDFYGTERGVDAQHGDLAACDGTGIRDVAQCADARSRHNEVTLVDHAKKLEAKAKYIGNLGDEVGIDAATGEGTVMLADGTMGSHIDKNREDIAAETTARMAEDTAIRGEFAAEDTAIRGEFAAADTALGTRIDDEATARMAADTTEMEARMAADTALDGRIDAEAKMRMDTDMMLAGGLDANKGMIMTNADAISGLDGRVGANASAIMRNSDMIGGLSDDRDVVRAGVAASMALAGMPAVNGRGIAIGVGSFDGESAFAVGFQIAGEQASFKVGVTSSGGATGASAGVGFNF